MMKLSVEALVVSFFGAVAHAATTLPLYNFTQLVHHDGSSNLTFQQRFQLDTSHFRPGGPILFFQGAENVPGLEATPIDITDFYDAAIALGGIAVGIEHRFFGTSFPPGFDGSARSYAPLTLENVLADSVTLAEWVRRNVTGAAESPIFIESGSYGAVISANARLKFPDTFYGAFISSGPNRSFGPWLNNTDRFQINDWGSNVYYDLSSTAANKIKVAMRSLHTCSRNGTCPSTFPDIQLCDPQPTATQWTGMYDSLVNLYSGIAQFSLPIGSVYPADAILSLINLTLTADSPGAVLRSAIHVANWQTGAGALGHCGNWTSPNATAANAAGKKSSWAWIRCNYVMTNRRAIGEHNMLPATEAARDGRAEVCLIPEWGGRMSNFTNEQWIKYYGFDKLAEAERMIFINGKWDPVAGVSVVPGLVEVADRNKPRSIVVDGLGHTADLFGEVLVPVGMKPNLDTIRNTKKEYIREWTAGYHRRAANTTSSL